MCTNKFKVTKTYVLCPTKSFHANHLFTHHATYLSCLFINTYILSFHLSIWLSTYHLSIISYIYRIMSHLSLTNYFIVTWQFVYSLFNFFLFYFIYYCYYYHSNDICEFLIMSCPSIIVCLSPSIYLFIIYVILWWK